MDAVGEIFDICENFPNLKDKILENDEKTDFLDLKLEILDLFPNRKNLRKEPELILKEFFGEGAEEEQFFSEPQVEQIENKPGVKKPQSFDIQAKEEIVNEKGYRAKVVLQEIKSKKFNMLMRPSLYDDLKKVATRAFNI
ncbi:MAG: hypothetical protein LBS61_03780 [Endomicrobium sp.]|nr:hypothetical protein [Endomicrobium sp.]